VRITRETERENVRKNNAVKTKQKKTKKVRWHLFTSSLSLLFIFWSLWNQSSLHKMCFGIIRLIWLIACLSRRIAKKSIESELFPTFYFYLAIFDLKNSKRFLNDFSSRT